MKIDENILKENDEDVLQKQPEQTKNDLLLILDKPYKFDDKSYKEVDLSGMEDINAEALSKIERSFSKKGISAVQPEVSVSYAVMLATEASGLPIEFFNGLPAREAIKLKNMVVNFFYA